MMSYFDQLVSTLREQMSATLSRSDVLKPLAWLIGLELTALILLTTIHASGWLIETMSVVFIASAILYALSYLFCLFRDRDALRSERYSLQKLALEHSILGDSLTGMSDSKKGAPALAVSSSRIERPEGDV